jgi:hypothetical protein
MGGFSIGTAETVAAALDGVREGDSWRCLCPVHGGHSLIVSESANGRLLFKCFGGDCSYFEIVAALSDCGIDSAPRYSDDAIDRTPDAELRIAGADSLYRQARSSAGTPVETYLRSRAITLPIPSVLRYLPQAPHRCGWHFSAMAAPVADVDNALIGVHLTFVKSDGSGKYPFSDKSLQRESRGLLRGGAIRLGDFDPERELIVGEGIETALSAMEVLGLPGWAASSAGGLRTLELPLAVRAVLIAADNDRSGTGQRSALAAYDRWVDEGRAVRIRCPSVVGHDYNDVLLGRTR